MTQRAYFDWNANALLRPQARAAMEVALDAVGNASSVHAEGRSVRALIEKARAQVAALVGAAPKDVTFTSGATEANTFALTPLIGAPPRDRLFVSAVEHPSVLCGGRFSKDKVEELPVDDDGVVDLAALAKAIARADRPLVSVMLANNETGVVQPLARVAPIVHAAGGLLHVDAVQAPGRMACRIDELDADFVTLSAHKIGGPQGAGALIRRGDRQLDPLVKGGGQERGLRGGTENIAAIAGFGAAAEACATFWREEASRMASLRDRLEAGLHAVTPDAIIFGARVTRLPNTTFFAVPGVKAETAIIAFDLNGIAVSSGAACSSGKVQPSTVLKAMGVAEDLVRGAVRVSLGHSTTEAEIDMFLQTWKLLLGPLLRERRGLAA